MLSISMHVYDAILLDLGLPGADGLDVLRIVRRSGNQVPVIVVTARDSVQDRIRALDGGADDYLIKPFDMLELKARMRAVVRRRGGHAAALLINGVLTLDPATREAVSDGVTTRLSSREFALLQALMIRPGGRDEIARNSAIATVMPFAVLVPLLLIALRLIVDRMFRPLAMLSASLDVRPDDDLSPVSDASVPGEVMPSVVAINRLLARVSASITSQRRFIADAAHELRSPLTALSLQAERLDACVLPPPARERLDALRRGLKRTRDLLSQLLTFARLQSDHAEETEAVHVQEIFRNVLEDLMPLVEARRMDIGVSGARDVFVDASFSDVLILIRNLVDNAIRYTPEGGCVDLSAGIDDGRA